MENIQLKQPLHLSPQICMCVHISSFGIQFAREHGRVPTTLAFDPKKTH